MPVPKFEAFFTPLLQMCADGEIHSLNQAEAHMARKFGLSYQERNERTAGGSQTRVYNRMRWASTYLRWAGLLRRVGRGQFRITDEGRHVLATGPASIDRKYLLRYPAFAAFMKPKPKSRSPEPARSRGDNRPAPVRDAAGAQTPMPPARPARAPQPPSPARQQLQQDLQIALTRLRSQLDDDLLLRLWDAPPAVFERTVFALLLALNFGRLDGERERILIRERGEHGFAGVIRARRAGEDEPGFLALCHNPLFALDWHVLRNSGLTLPGSDGSKGMLITSARLAGEVLTAGGEHDLLLLDGKQMAALMIEYGIGVRVEQTLSTHTLVADYFE